MAMRLHYDKGSAGKIPVAATQPSLIVTLILVLAALPSPPLQRDFRKNRHCDFLRRDGAKIEARRRLDAVDQSRIHALRDKLLARCRHLAATADKGVIGGLCCQRCAQGGRWP